MSLIAEQFNIAELISEKQKLGLFRTQPIASEVGSQGIRISGKDYLNFASNDYLGLSSSEEIKNALLDGIQKYGAGTGASPLVTGFSPAHEELTEFIKDFTGKEAVLLFSTGFSANQTLIKAFRNLHADLVLDRLTHASMQDASFKYDKLFRFKHNDTAHLEVVLNKTEKPVIATEGIFSMDGDNAPLKEIVALKNKYKAPLIVDDAHGFGVSGPKGLGTIPASGLSFKDTDVLMCTLSKAVGLSGAFIASDKDFISYLINTSREYIYSTMAPAHLAYAAKKSLELIQSSTGEALRSHLQDLIQRFKKGIQSLDASLTTESHSAIQPILLGSTEKLLRVSEELKAQGIWCGAIRPPTVPQGTSRLRITLTAAHSTEDIDRLINALGNSLKCKS